MLSLAKPIMTIAIEAEAVIVMMPLNSFGILKILFNTPVIKPHKIPAKTPHIRAIHGFMPL